MRWVLLILLPFTALAMGAVHPWAYSIFELTALSVALWWMVAIIRGRSVWRSVSKQLGLIAAGALLLPGLVAFQLLPRPPTILRILSPGSYQSYQEGLPGWPNRAAYEWVGQVGSEPASHGTLPTEDEVQRGASVPFSLPKAAVKSARPAEIIAIGSWLPISVAPRLTSVGLLKLMAYGVVFLVVVFFPFSAAEERPFFNGLVRIVLITGLIIGLIGLAQPLFSNGRPLWIFTPLDWGTHNPWGARIFGTFANPDHFADYLAMIWPFALCGLLLPDILGEVKNRFAVPMLCGTVGLVLLAALIGTASRGGWLAALSSTVTVVGLAGCLPEQRRPAFLRSGKSSGRILITGALALGVLCVAALFASGSSQMEADRRFTDAIQHEKLSLRIEPARNSLAMIKRSPIFGVGMGAWPVIYPKYASPPWTGLFMNATHDEYVQFLSEMGFAGLLVAALVLWLAVGQVRGILELPSEVFPTAAACAGSISAVAVHSLFDFPLRIPANALLAAICLGALVRLCSQTAAVRNQTAAGTPRRVAAALAIALLMLAAWSVVRQPSQPFPYDTEPANTVEEAVINVLQYPTYASGHLQLAKLLYGHQGGETQRQEEIAAVLALEPLNPVARDIRAIELIAAGKRAEALAEVEQSVADAPSAEYHFYLRGRFLPWLSPGERTAILAGLKRAANKGYWPATDTLVHVYESFSMYADEATFLVAVAARESDSAEKSRILSRSGLAFAKAGQLDQAEQALGQAIDADPENADSYRNLAVEVYGRRSDFDKARTVIDRGFVNGASSVVLYVALAELRAEDHDLSSAEKALEQAAAAEPFNFDLVKRLGLLYFSDQKYDHAATWLRKATELNPESADIYFQLGLAEEAGYQYFPADKDFARALALDDKNSQYLAHYADFKKKVAEARRQ